MLFAEAGSPAGWPVGHPQRCVVSPADRSWLTCQLVWEHTDLSHVAESSVGFEVEFWKSCCLGQLAAKVAWCRRLSPESLPVDQNSLSQLLLWCSV